MESSRRAAKELARFHPLGGTVKESKLRSTSSAKAMMCPELFWRKVAPTLSEASERTPDRSNEQGNGVEAACIARADEIRASLEEAMHIKPELEASKARIAHLVRLQQCHAVETPVHMFPPAFCLASQFETSPMFVGSYRFRKNLKSTLRGIAMN